ncbi:MAG: hypothetical protein EOP85_11510 [Verrucomicrobiaceae bacterium]|nr:MAG: hypothetical protein EOP85_11510 [Verrucomicrobiaceae bacterium]
MFDRRGEVTPSDPLEFHLYHLARYWSRIVGFIRQYPGDPERWMDGNGGQAIRIANGFTESAINPASKVLNEWQIYKVASDATFHKRPLSGDDIEKASAAFERFLVAAGYNPWLP